MQATTESLKKDSFWLEKALTEAKKRQGWTAPNPAVGAIWIKNGEISGSGFHLGPGHPHAEVEALKNSGPVAGGTLYVTLEPCSHFGRTPPCAELLISKKVDRVVYGFSDPNPIVKGNGDKKLKAAGILVQKTEIPSVVHFYRAYQYFHVENKSWLIGKMAISADGFISATDGTPRKISGKETDEFTHTGRLHSDAILTSARTVLCDNPQFTVRLGEKTFKKKVYVLDRHLEIPETSRLVETAEELTLISNSSAPEEKKMAWKKKGVRILTLAELGEIESLLAGQGLHRVWVELGPRLFDQMLNLNLFKELRIYRCATRLGQGTKSFNETSLSGYEQKESKKIGDDCVEFWKQA